MSEFKGTKGEWKIKHSESKDAYNIIGTRVGGRYKIARVPYLQVEKSDNFNESEKEEAITNAQLIALAGNLAQKYPDIQNWERLIKIGLQHDPPKSPNSK